MNICKGLLILILQYSKQLVLRPGLWKNVWLSSHIPFGYILRSCPGHIFMILHSLFPVKQNLDPLLNGVQLDDQNIFPYTNPLTLTIVVSIYILLSSEVSEFLNSTGYCYIIAKTIYYYVVTFKHFIKTCHFQIN